MFPFLLVIIALLLLAILIGLDTVLALLFWLVVGALILVVIALVLGLLFGGGALLYFNVFKDAPHKDTFILCILFILVALFIWWDQERLKK